jgi:hypothetical protein
VQVRQTIAIASLLKWALERSEFCYQIENRPLFLTYLSL